MQDETAGAAQRSGSQQQQQQQEESLESEDEEEGTLLEEEYRHQLEAVGHHAVRLSRVARVRRDPAAL